MTHITGKKNLTGALLFLVLLAAGATAMLAADSDDKGIIGSKGPHSWIGVMPPPAVIEPTVGPDTTKLYTITSYLGPKGDVYSTQFGYYISGPDTEYLQNWAAMYFIPAVDAEVTVIEVPVLKDPKVGGANAVTISLNEDANSLPGKPMHVWNLHNLPDAGTCCKLDVEKDAKGLKVKANTVYWIVASTNHAAQTAQMVWMWTAPQTYQGYQAYNSGSGWSLEFGALGAFGVFGHKIQ